MVLEFMFVLETEKGVMKYKISKKTKSFKKKKKKKKNQSSPIVFST